MHILRSFLFICMKVIILNCFTVIHWMCVFPHMITKSIAALQAVLLEMLFVGGVFFFPICLFISHRSQLFLNFIASWGRPWTHSSPAALAYQLSRCWILPHLDSRCLSVLGASDSFSVSPLPPLLLLLMFFPLLNFIIFFISNIQEFL